MYNYKIIIGYTDEEGYFIEKELYLKHKDKFHGREFHKMVNKAICNIEHDCVYDLLDNIKQYLKCEFEFTDLNTQATKFIDYDES